MSDQEHNIESTSLARSQGLTLARCCDSNQGLSRGIKIVMDSHTILLMIVLNMMFLYMHVYVAGQFCRCTITDKNCIFRNIAESPTVAPESL